MPDEPQLIIPDGTARTHLKNIGFGALPDNPSKANYSAKEIKSAGTRPSMYLFDLIKNNAEYVDDMEGRIQDELDEKVTLLIVDELPASGDKGKIYLVPTDNETSQNYFDEYVWDYENGKFERLTPQLASTITSSDHKPASALSVYNFLSERNLVNASDITVPNWDD